jgi:hypothetical protein
MSEDDLESQLAQEVSAYRRIDDDRRMSRQWDARLNPELDAAARALAGTLERVIQRHVEVTTDGLLIRSFVPSSSESVEIRGHMWCLGLDSNCWREPFWARVALSSDGQSIRDYPLGLGSGAHGLRNFPCDSPRSREPSSEEEWIFYVPRTRVQG